MVLSKSIVDQYITKHNIAKEPKTGTVQVYLNKRMDKQIMVYSFSRIPLSTKKEQTTATWKIWINHKMITEIITLVGSTDCGQLADRGTKELSGLIEIFYIVWILWTQVYVFVKTHQTVHLTSVHFIDCKS